MKNYLRVLETSKKDRIHKTVQIRGGTEELGQWQAISLTEEMAEILLERLRAVVPPTVDVKVVKVNLNFFKSADPDSTVLVRGQLYENEHKTVLLKVFVHQVDGRGKTTRVARSVYELRLASNGNQIRVA